MFCRAQESNQICHPFHTSRLWTFGWAPVHHSCSLLCSSSQLSTICGGTTRLATASYYIMWAFAFTTTENIPRWTCLQVCKLPQQSSCCGELLSCKLRQSRSQYVVEGLLLWRLLYAKLSFARGTESCVDNSLRWDGINNYLNKTKINNNKDNNNDNEKKHNTNLMYYRFNSFCRMTVTAAQW